MVSCTWKSVYKKRYIGLVTLCYGFAQMDRIGCAQYPVGMPACSPQGRRQLPTVGEASLPKLPPTSVTILPLWQTIQGDIKGSERWIIFSWQLSFFFSGPAADAVADDQTRNTATPKYSSFITKRQKYRNTKRHKYTKDKDQKGITQNDAAVKYISFVKILQSSL